MQAGIGLLGTVVMPIYMIMIRYSHNYAQFYQLLNSNLFTTVILMLSREATSETYGPRVYITSYEFPIDLPIFVVVPYVAIFTFQSINQKCQRYLL